MKRLFATADAYLKHADWKDLALIKFCLFAIGVMIGITVVPEKKKSTFVTALLVFVATYIPLMKKFTTIAIGCNTKE